MVPDSGGHFNRVYGAVVMIPEVQPSGPEVWLVDMQQFLFPIQSACWFAAGLVTNNELAIASRYSSARAKMHYLAGRALVRHALTQTAHYNPRHIHIVLGENNKPVLANNTNEVQWHFNISHSGDLVACALASSKIGIDIEMISHTADYLSIARAHFSDEEASWVAAKPASINERFVALWTIKEAYLKAIGIGLAIPISRVMTAGVKLRSCLVFSEDVLGWYKWHCRLMKPASGYWLSICYESGLEKIKIKWTKL